MIYLYYNISKTKLRENMSSAIELKPVSPELCEMQGLKYPDEEVVPLTSAEEVKAVARPSISLSALPPRPSPQQVEQPQPPETTSRSCNAFLAIGLGVGFVALGGLLLGLTLVLGALLPHAMTMAGIILSIILILLGLVILGLGIHYACSSIRSSL